MTHEKINDMNGNSFFPTKAEAMLSDSGWRLQSKVRRGCVRQAWWVSPDGERWGQGAALEQVRRAGIASGAARARSAMERENEALKADRERLAAAKEGK